MGDEADYLEDGEDYYRNYSVDCDDDCMNCEFRYECEDSPYEE